MLIFYLLIAYNNFPFLLYDHKLVVGLLCSDSNTLRQNQKVMGVISSFQVPSGFHSVAKEVTSLCFCL